MQGRELDLLSSFREMQSPTLTYMTAPLVLVFWVVTEISTSAICRSASLEIEEFRLNLCNLTDLTLVTLLYDSRL